MGSTDCRVYRLFEICNNIFDYFELEKNLDELFGPMASKIYMGMNPTEINKDASAENLKTFAELGINKFGIQCMVGSGNLDQAHFIEVLSAIMDQTKFQKKDIIVVIEQVSAMPGQGVTSMFNFGQSFGVLKGICSAMQLSMYFVRPAKWKKYFGLIKTEKDASRTKVIEIFPYISSQLFRKKDSNKADAVLIASFFYNTYKKAD